MASKSLKASSLIEVAVVFFTLNFVLSLALVGVLMGLVLLIVWVDPREIPVWLWVFSARFAVAGGIALTLCHLYHYIREEYPLG